MVNNIEDLMALAGSVEKLAVCCDISAQSVFMWRHRGIPDRLWAALIKQYDVTPAELYSINQKIRRKKVK